MKATSHSHLMTANAAHLDERSVVTRTIMVDGKRVTATLETSTKVARPRVSRAAAIAQLDAMHSDEDPPIVTGDLNKRLRIL